MIALPRAWVEEALAALYPPACWVCGAWAPDAFACAEHRLVRPAPVARCGRCAVRLPAGVPDGERCLECRRAPPAFARAFVWGDWGPGPLREWVLAFKHGGRRDLARPLASELALALEGRAGEFDLVVPVPLHPLRRLSRGYDQTQRLARALAELTGLGARRLLVRRRWTPPQGGPGASSRTTNVRGAFRAALFARRALRGRRVLLVDDVVTSGATVRECAEVLRDAGAASIAVAALARASRGDFDPHTE